MLRATEVAMSDRLAELRAALDQAVCELPADMLPEVIGLLEVAKQRALARVTMPAQATVPISSTWVSADQVAAAFNVPATQVYEQARQGRLPHLKLGKYTRFSLDEVRQALVRADGFKSGSFGTRKAVKKRNKGAASRAPVGAATALLPNRGDPEIAGVPRGD
jgi:excisionase family DNA binding protein